MEQTLEAIIAISATIAQLGVAAASFRLASKVAKRQDQQDDRLDRHEVRIGVLEGKQ